MMDCHPVLLTLSLFTVYSGADSKEITEDFDCCDLPKDFSVDRHQETEFTIANKSVASASETTFEAIPPLKTNGDNVLTLEQCVDVHQKNVYVNEKGKAEENNIHHRRNICATANRTKEQPSPHKHTGLIVSGVVVLPVLLVPVVIWMKIRGRRVPGEMV